MVLSCGWITNIRGVLGVCWGAVGFETRSSAGCVKDTPMRLFRVFLDHGNPILSQPSRPIPAVSRAPVFLAAGSFTDVLGISTHFKHYKSK